MSPLTDTILWIAISIGVLLCATGITAYRYTRGRRPLTMERYHTEAERAYREAKAGAKAPAASSAPAR